jgi:hypothetical protein
VAAVETLTVAKNLRVNGFTECGASSATRGGSEKAAQDCASETA